MATALRARSTPYRAELKPNERVCPRCGIHFTINPRRIHQHDECRDCR